MAWNNLLIKHKYYPKHDPIIDRDIPFILSLPGFELLNQIRTKKSIEKLDDSINRFNESSDKSSKKLIDLTLSIYVFTLIVVALPMIESIIEPIKNNIHSWLFWYFVGIIGIAAIMYFGLKFLYKP